MTQLRKSRVLSRLQLARLSPTEKQAIRSMLVWRWTTAAPPQDARRFVEILARHRLLGVLEHCARRDTTLHEWLARAGTCQRF
ncbi:MAG: hypothetical protein ABIY55_07845 [Kofleriaceae bacterium]